MFFQKTFPIILSAQFFNFDICLLTKKAFAKNSGSCYTIHE